MCVVCRYCVWCVGGECCVLVWCGGGKFGVYLGSVVRVLCVGVHVCYRYSVLGV